MRRENRCTSWPIAVRFRPQADTGWLAFGELPGPESFLGVVENLSPDRRPARSRREFLPCLARAG